MRFSIIAIAIAVAACAPAKPPVVRHEPAAVPSATIPPVAGLAPAIALPAAATANPAAYIHRNIHGIEFEGVSFDSRTVRLKVVDQSRGPGSIYADARAAAEAHGGIAAVNAGFFTPEGSPLGLLVTNGEPRGSWNRSSSLGSGVWYETAAGRSAIARREALGSASAGMRELLQAGPMLVDQGRPVNGLENVKTSARVAVLWDGGTRWWIGRSSPCTLAEFAGAIAAGNPAGWSATRALNLDGGRSADLWISGSVAGGPITRRPAWNRPVRNFFVLVPRGG
jgi:uncharacterized protein YigE (DUF2233 family)